MLCEEVESLLRQGYCFEYFSNINTNYRVMFYKHGQGVKRFFAFNRDTPHMLVEDKNYMFSRRSAGFPEDIPLIDLNLSRQLLWFVFDYGKQPMELLNWVGWREKKEISILIERVARRPSKTSYPIFTFYFDDFKKREAARSAELAGIVFPEEIAPVSEIIRGYAVYSLYDFLVEKFEEITKE